MTTRLPHPIEAPLPGYHSKTAYSIPVDQADAIIRMTAYHRTDFDKAVISFPPSVHDKMTSGLPAVREPRTLGALARLPLELINAIFLQLDIESISHFYHGNARALQVLDALHEYQIVTMHAQNAFDALLQTHSASRVTLQDFYRLIRTQTCSVCNECYGDLVFLPTRIRCCSGCLRNGHRSISVVTLASVKRRMNLLEQSIAKLPTLITLSGGYTIEQRARLMSMTVVPALSALTAFSNDNPTQTLTGKLDFEPTFILSFMACCSLPSYDSRTTLIDNGVSCAGCQLALEKWITTPVKVIWAEHVRDLVYTRGEFLEHFKRCEQTQVFEERVRMGQLSLAA